MSVQEGPLPIWSWTLDPELRAEAPEMDLAILWGPGGRGASQPWERLRCGTLSFSGWPWAPHMPFFLHLPLLSFCTQRNWFFWFCRSR